MQDPGSGELPQPLPPYEDAYQKVIDLRNRLSPIKGNRMTGRLNWFPDPDKQAVIVADDKPNQARFIAEVLGHCSLWGSMTSELTRFRPQDRFQTDRGTMAGDLGLTQEQAASVFQTGVIPVGHAIQRYRDYLIDEVLGGDWVLLANAVTTTRQLIGLREALLRHQIHQEYPITLVTPEGENLTDIIDILNYIEAGADDQGVSITTDPESHQVTATAK